MPRGLARIPAVRSRMAIAVVLAFTGPSIGFAQVPGSDPDWPCIQRYIPELSPAQVWNGPDPATLGEHWASDPAVAPLVPRLASSATDLGEAEREIEAFAEGLPPAERERRLTLLFAGLFETLDAERRKAVERVRSFARGQRALAERIREESEALLREQPDAAGGATLAALDERTKWDLRLFEERRAALPAVCEQPDLLERRLFALARAIERALSPDRGG